MFEDIINKKEDDDNVIFVCTSCGFTNRSIFLKKRCIGSSNVICPNCGRKMTQIRKE